MVVLILVTQSRRLTHNYVKFYFYFNFGNWWPAQNRRILMPAPLFGNFQANTSKNLAQLPVATGPLWAREIEPVYEARGKAVDTGVRDGQSRLPFEIKDATNNLWHNKPRQCDFDVENKLAIGNEMTTVKATRRA